MSQMVHIRNTLTDSRREIEACPGQTVQEAVTASGFIASGHLFSVRDKDGQVVDDRPVTDFAGTTLSVGLPGEDIVGGAEQKPA